MKFQAFAICAAVAVSGCMGGGGSAELPPLDHEAYRKQALGYTDRIKSGAAKPLTAAQAPSGTVSMRGMLLTKGSGDTIQLVGTMDMDANFGANTITGKVTDMGMYPVGKTFVRKASVDGTLSVNGTMTKEPTAVTSKVSVAGDISSKGGDGIKPFTGKVSLPNMTGGFGRDTDGTMLAVGATKQGYGVITTEGQQPSPAVIEGAYVASEVK